MFSLTRFIKLFKKPKKCVNIDVVATLVHVSPTRQKLIDDMIKRYKVVHKTSDSYYIKLLILQHKIYMYSKTTSSMDDFEHVTVMLLEYDRYLNESL
jgi:hypothetical protein